LDDDPPVEEERAGGRRPGPATGELSPGPGAATQIGIFPVLAAASNSSGGVMGKMIDAQSIVVGGVATGQEGHEGNILRYVFFHSIALAWLVGLLVLAQAYVFPGVVP
jgi:lactate permease